MRPRWMIWTDLNSFCLKCYKDESVGCSWCPLWLHKGFRWKTIRLKAWYTCQLFQWNMKRMILDLGRRQNDVRNKSDVSSLGRLKSCAITVWKIYVFRQMVHGGNWKNIALIETLIAIQINVSFVWSTFLLGVFHQWRSPHRSFRWRGKKEKEKEKGWNAWFVLYCFFSLFWSKLITQFMHVCFISDCHLLGTRIHILITPSK